MKLVNLVSPPSQLIKLYKSGLVKLISALLHLEIRKELYIRARSWCVFTLSELNINYDKDGKIHKFNFNNNFSEIPAEIKSEIKNLLQEFYNITGCPVLLNTSFNVDGKPILSTYRDAYQVYKTSQMYCLILQDYYLFKWIQKL